MLAKEEFDRLYGLYRGGCLDEKGREALAPYRVDNAVILAAGLSARFAPLSWEKPKGLLPVRGEVLIERQIRQLHDAGVKDIALVVGYMGKAFSYLRDKFGVDIVENPDYQSCNNTSSLIRVTERLKNSYICSSDNYFAENVFEPYVYDSYYASVFVPGRSDEWGLVCRPDGRIAAVDHEPVDRWCMMGQVYFSQDFSARFAPLLEREYAVREQTRQELWECLLERHLDELAIYERRYEAGVIREFDSLEELRAFDERYLDDSGSETLRALARSLGCREGELTGIRGIAPRDGRRAFSYVFRGREGVCLEGGPV